MSLVTNNMTPPGFPDLTKVCYESKVSSWDWKLSAASAESSGINSRLEPLRLLEHIT